jgi:hypothetical protein
MATAVIYTQHSFRMNVKVTGSCGKAKGSNTYNIIGGIR